MTRIAVGAAAALTLLLTGLARAEYPDKPIRLYVPFPAGGAVDIVARLVAARLADDLGKPVLVENKAGAGGIIATDATAKAAPDGATPAGIGTLPHVTMELLLKRTGIQVTHIPYRGAAPAMNDLLAGQVQLKLDTYATSHPQVAASKLRMLGIASAERSRLMPEIPTIAEMGLPGYEGILWIGMMAPAGTPKAVIDRLAAANAEAVRAPDVIERLAAIGVDPVGGTTAEFAALIGRELAQWRELAKAANIKLQ
jgi:tripartite-type tricarboxylate transporter receptor subunit TctC